MSSPVQLGNVAIGGAAPLALIAGPCVIETEAMTLQIAEFLKKVCERLQVALVFKASFDKANRTSAASFRGPGMDEGLRILERVRTELELPVISDVHDTTQIAAAADVLDVLQIPAFLCRQSELLAAAAATGKAVNVKKGQFLAPWDMPNVVDKLRRGGAADVLVTERGTSFGYNNLVVDMRSLVLLAETGCPVVFDATHAVQLPGGQGGCSGGERRHVAALSRAAVAVGIDALFWEVHPDPDRAACDGPNSLELADVEKTLWQMVQFDKVTRAGAV